MIYFCLSWCVINVQTQAFRFCKAVCFLVVDLVVGLVSLSHRMVHAHLKTIYCGVWLICLFVNFVTYLVLFTFWMNQFCGTSGKPLMFINLRCPVVVKLFLVIVYIADRATGFRFEYTFWFWSMSHIVTFVVIIATVDPCFFNYGEDIIFVFSLHV